jgi:hypothetical protein
MGVPNCRLPYAWTHYHSVCCVHCTEYLNERLTKLLDESISTENWLDVATGWETILNLRSEMTAERGQAILDCTSSCAQLFAAILHVLQP